MTRVALTYQDYEALPADGRRYEVHDGELSVTPAPSPQHQIVARNLGFALHAHVRARALGEVLLAPLDVILSDFLGDTSGDTSIVQPDIVYVDPSRLGAISRRGIEGAPTLAVEILSPSTTLTDRVTKPQLYARYGVPYFWLADLEARTIDAFVLGPEGYAHAARVSGHEPVGVPPFPDLALIPETLWP